MDWSYSDARRRLLEAAGDQLPRHTASGRLDDAANRLVDCSCGWAGNALGWAAHLDHVVCSALDGGGSAAVAD